MCTADSAWLVYGPSALREEGTCCVVPSVRTLVVRAGRSLVGLVIGLDVIRGADGAGASVLGM